PRREPGIVRRDRPVLESDQIAVHQRSDAAVVHPGWVRRGVVPPWTVPGPVLAVGVGIGPVRVRNGLKDAGAREHLTGPGGDDVRVAVRSTGSVTGIELKVKGALQPLEATVRHWLETRRSHQLLRPGTGQVEVLVVTLEPAVGDEAEAGGSHQVG